MIKYFGLFMLALCACGFPQTHTAPTITPFNVMCVDVGGCMARCVNDEVVCYKYCGSGFQCKFVETKQ